MTLHRLQHNLERLALEKLSFLILKHFFHNWAYATFDSAASASKEHNILIEAHWRVFGSATPGT